jgi:hypothetical protein
VTVTELRQALAMLSSEVGEYQVTFLRPDGSEDVIGPECEIDPEKKTVRFLSYVHTDKKEV